jgi:hypothetical protein
LFKSCYLCSGKCFVNINLNSWHLISYGPVQFTLPPSCFCYGVEYMLAKMCVQIACF